MSRSRVWYSDTDVVLPDTSTAAKGCHSALHCMKGVLLGDLVGTHGPEGAAPIGAKWTIDGSCDSTATSSGDLLGGATFNDAKWVRATAGTPHTWWTAHSSEGLYICVDYSSPVDYQINIWFANSAFSGGTTSNRPTSATEWAVGGPTGGNNFQMWSNNALPGKVHVCRDPNGGFYMLISQDGQISTPGTWWTGHKLDFTCTADPLPFFSSYMVSWGGTILNTSTYGGGRNSNNTASVSMDLMVVSGPAGNVPNHNSLDADGNESTEPVAIYYDSVAGGRKGYMTDAKWGPSLGARLEPVVGNAERALINGMWLPFSVYPTF